MEELDYKILLPENTRNIFVGITDPYSKSETDTEFAICAIQGQGLNSIVLGTKVISYKGKSIEERFKLIQEVIEYYGDCKIAIETDDSTISYEKYKLDIDGRIR